jgi:EAL domain-containing protein (putative c-di-GMP-specific phosphodiesterase class I)
LDTALKMQRERRVARVPAADDDGGRFLRALARRIDVRLVVFVPLTRRARSLWISSQGNDAEVDRLETVGREWLEKFGTSVDGEVDPEASTVSGLPSVTVAAARSRHNGIVGAVVADKDRSGAWSTAERALVGFVADYYGSSLDRATQRPQPGRSVLLGVDMRPGQSHDLERGIRAAPGKGELFLVYQPEIDLGTNEVVAVEALVRWHHPQHGELGPESFIALAEQSDLIKILGAWVIGESLREFASWLEELPDIDVSLRVNVSPVQLVGDGLATLFAAALAENGLRGEQVCVEITENALPEDAGELPGVLTALKSLGISCAIDDLATGYSTLSRLRSLPVDIVKIDRSLVCGIDDDWRAQAIVSAVIRLARDLGIGLVAEGVENAAEAAALVQLGCTRAQGHYFARPTNAAEVLTLLRKRGRKLA